MRRLSALAFATAFAVLAACSVDASISGAPTAPERDDSGVVDTDPGTEGDGGSDGEDSGDGSGDDGGTTPDAAKPRTGDILGTLSGACGVLSAAITSASPSLFENDLGFMAGEQFTKASLSSEGKIVYDTPNAGGSSFESEVMSFEVLHHCEAAKLVKTETQIKYKTASGPITDILVEIGGKKVGVSVTRAYRPSTIPFPDADVKKLLEDKLDDVVASSARVDDVDKWVKQILHVFVATQSAEDAVKRVLPTIDATTRADTVIVLTRTTGGGFVYCNPDPPLGSECP